MKFSDKLRALIEERNITQKQLAANLQIPVSTLGGYVQGTSEPDFETLKLLAVYFNVTTDYLLNFRSGITKNHGEDELLRLYRTLPDDYKDLLLDQGKMLVRRSVKANIKN